MGKTYKHVFDFHSTNLFCVLWPDIMSSVVEGSKLKHNNRLSTVIGLYIHIICMNSNNHNIMTSNHISK